MRTIHHFLAVCSFLFVLSAAGVSQTPQMQPFSGDMKMTTAGSREVTGKMYMGQGAMRMDMEHDGQQSVMITRFANKTVDILMPKQQMYMEFNAGQNAMRRGPGMDQLKPYDPKNPCSAEEGATCKNLGTETVNGRMCDHWQVTSKEGKVSDLWIDQKLHFPIKGTNADTTWLLTNIKEGDPGASLFEVPADYKKMNLPTGMMPGGPKG